MKMRKQMTLLLLAAMLSFPSLGAVAQNQNPTQSVTAGQVRIYCVVKVSPENHDRVVELYRQLVALSKTEEGCIDYDLFENALDPTTLIIFETWANADSHARHGKTEHFQRLFPEIRKLCTMTGDRLDRK